MPADAAGVRHPPLALDRIDGDDRARQPRPTGREEVSAALVDAATTLFAEHGFTAVSTRDIARAAGVSHTLLFRHFGSKDALIAAVAAHAAGFGPTAPASGSTVRPIDGTSHLEMARASKIRTLLFARLGLDIEQHRHLPEVFPLLELYLQGVEAVPGVEPPVDVLAEPRVIAFLTLSLSSGYLLNEATVRTRFGFGTDGGALDAEVALAIDALVALRRLDRVPPEVAAVRARRSAAPRTELATLPAATQRGRRPHGREEVRRAVLDAAAELFGRHEIGAVGVRELAAASGVQPALVFRHFGTKAGVVAALLDERVQGGLQTVTAMRSTRDDLYPLFADYWGPEGFGALVLRARFAGYEPDTMQQGFPVAARMIELLDQDLAGATPSDGQRVMPPLLALGAVTWLLSGAAMLAPVLRDAYRLDDVDLAAVAADAAQVLLELARSADTCEAVVRGRSADHAPAT
ncbi:MAG: TetR family transcriptional regulator [Acidimicrobiales bacterium]|jgi:AcrR family transcriptional regulator|nr:TetR family transcriptional regulator [Acidimicrobiales bacterium]